MADIDHGDEPAFLPLGPEGKEELTEAEQDLQNKFKGEASDALEDGKKDLALEKLTEAFAVGCVSAMMYSKRAQLLLELDRPRAAVRDCCEALKTNPDSAKAFKIRAKAYLKLERWEDAHLGFQTALKIDFDGTNDDQTQEEALQVAIKVKELQASTVKDRNDKEKEEYTRKLKESKDQYEANMKARESEFRDQRMKEEEEKKKTEEERKARVRQREGAEAEGESSGPKSHSPPEPGAAEDVD